MHPHLNRFVCAVVIALASAAMAIRAQSAVPASETASNNCNGPCLAVVSFTEEEGWTAESYRQIKDKDPLGCTGNPEPAVVGFSAHHKGPGTVDDWGGWDTRYEHHCDEVVSAANYPGGRGGKGYRRWRGDGSVNNGGSMKIGWSGVVMNISVCYRMRYSKGFRWVNGRNPHMTKEMYFNDTRPNTVIFGHQAGGWAIQWPTGSVSYRATKSPRDWLELFRAPSSDGLFHEFAVMYDVANKIARIWIDDKMVLNEMHVRDKSVTQGPNFFTMLNQNFVDNDNDGVTNDPDSPDGYTDYDDIVVDTDVSDMGKLEC